MMTTTAVQAPVPKKGLVHALGQAAARPATPTPGPVSATCPSSCSRRSCSITSTTWRARSRRCCCPTTTCRSQFFLYLLVVSNAIGAFSAFIGGLSDKIGRANLTIYGTLLVALIQLFAIPHITDKWGFAGCVLRDRLRRGRHPRLDAGARCATSHRRWVAAWPWASGRSGPRWARSAPASWRRTRSIT